MVRFGSSGKTIKQTKQPFRIRKFIKIQKNLKFTIFCCFDSILRPFWNCHNFWSSKWKSFNSSSFEPSKAALSDGLLKNFKNFIFWPKKIDFLKKFRNVDQKTAFWLARVLKIEKFHFFLFYRPKNTLNNDFLTSWGWYRIFLTLWKSLLEVLSW